MQDWIWDGGRPSVDFLNTLRDRALSRSGRETLNTPDDLAHWLQKAGLSDSAQATPQDLEAAHGLRTAIDEAASAIRRQRRPPDTAVALLNKIAAAVTLTPELRIHHNEPYKAEARDTKAGLARLAIDAIDLLTTEDANNLRTCEAKDCGVRFLDRSPARNRQWCSMRRCGNRNKARRHYTKVKRTTP